MDKIAIEEITKMVISCIQAGEETEYKYPVRYADVIDVSTKVLEVSDIKIVFENIITNQNGKLCTKGKTTLVCVTQEGVPTSMGKEVKEAMGL